MKNMDRITYGERIPETDLLSAFVLCGAESVMDTEEMQRVANHLATDDPAKAWRLSGHLARGEDMPPDIAEWVAQVGKKPRPPFDFPDTLK